MTGRPTVATGALLLAALRFGSEIAVLVAFAVVGARALDGWLAVAVAIALPLVVVAAWGRWVAPRSRHLLPDPARAGVEAVVFLGGAVGLFVVGLVGWAVALAVVATVSAVGVRLLPWEPGTPT